MSKQKKALFNSALSLLLCFSMLLGTTWAWFTDSVTSTNNIIKSGKLDVEMYYCDTNSADENDWNDASKGSIFNYEYWEPGFVQTKYVKIVNKGDLAFKYVLNILPNAAPVAGEANLADVIDVYVAIDPGTTEITRENMTTAMKRVGTLAELMADSDGAARGILIPAEGKRAPSFELPTTDYKEGSFVVGIALKMQEDAGNEYQDLTVGGGGFKVQLLATQYTYENDSFGNDYDTDSEWHGLGLKEDVSVSADVTVENGAVKNEVVLEASDVKATVSEGVAVNEGTTRLILTVSEKDSTDSGLTTGTNEELMALDVHIEGVSESNTTPIVIALGKVLPVGMNLGNVALYHVENGTTNAMTQVGTPAEVDAHNEFYYDPATGEVTVAMATFSELTLLADNTKAWEGNVDHTWYDASKTELTIANADQLWSFSQIVGGMAKDSEGNTIAQDSFSDKTVKLIADVNLGDDEENNNSDIIFHPIGYYYTDDKNADGTTGDYYSTVNSFEGTFDGNGHTIANFYQNTWEIKGDYDGNYYSDAMGLFGYVVGTRDADGNPTGGIIKNLTVDNFSSDGEFTPTGVIAAYAVNSTFENIAITNCNPRVYNTGNGGIVGIGGNSDDPDTYKLTFNNITIDNSNIISALWGSWDVACGGLVGMFRGDGHVYMTNCHVAAQIDVYNDVCGNYQYYWYRYSGMMVGTNKNMTTDANGYTVPETDKYHAENCTVHFGDWNDYYYCELVANSKASYTHDHQFSRLIQIQSVTEIQDANGNWNKGGNYILMNGKSPTETCYHIMKDASGKLYEHKHDVADATNSEINEVVNGETVLKENNQRIYLPFNQLFTGYGWGVKHIPVYNGEDYAFEGITILDREVADSVPKFEKVDTAKDSYMNGIGIKIGQLFKGKDQLEVAIDVDNVQVTVSPVPNTNSTVTAVYSANTGDWTQGILTFSGTGKATITITDYYFCTPTTITVNITERVAEEKFDVVMNNGDFLHRVGNDGTVALNKLFAAKKDIEIGTVSVTVETLNGTAASGTYTSNATWTNGTIQFSGTGVVKVTITDNDYCTPTVLYLEVVDATNLTSATGTTTGGNFVLLCDVNTSSYVNYWNCALYGNGFTYSLNGAPTAYNSKQGHGVIITKNATLDNLVIVGDVYNSYGAYTNQDYYNTAIDVVGETTIQNCYVANCAAPVSTREDVTITNTTLYGGTVANLIIKSGTVTLENVTTANYNDGRSLVGMGIVVHPDATETAKLELEGTLTQYNFISEANTPDDSNAKILYDAMFGSSCSYYQFGTSPNRYVNAGIISMTDIFNADDITDDANTGYVGSAVRVNSVNGYVYTQPNTSGSVDNGYDKENDPHVATTQGAVAPEYSFDYTSKNYQAKQDGSNDYCYEENGKVYISMDEGDTFNWDTSILTATKVGQALSYAVFMDGVDYTGKSIAFNTAGDYEVTYTYTDANNFSLDENGNITTYKKEYTKTVNISVAVIEAATKHAEFTFGSSNTASTTVTIGNNTYVMPNVSATSSTIGSTTVEGKTIYYPIVEIVMSDGKTSHTSGWYAYFPVFSGAVTITDYKDNGLGDAETFGSSTQSMPSGLSIVGDPAQLFKYQSSSTAGTSPVVKNNILVYSSPSISAKRSEYNTVIQYSYQDNAGATYYYYIGYHAPAQSYTSCVSSDTLVTLAGGSQKRIDEVTFADRLLVWDFDKGEYTTASSSIIENHGYGESTVVKLSFDDGTEVKVVNVHGFFDADLNKWVDIDAKNAHSYVGRSFTQVDDDGYKTVKLVNVEISQEYIEAWSILSADHYNCILEGVFSITPPATEQLAFFEIGADMKYDAETKQADIEQYGLYTYAEFEHLLTEEQFDALNVAEIKIAVGKGLITYEEILWLIATCIH